MGKVVNFSCSTRLLVISPNDNGYVLSMRPANTEVERNCRIFRVKRDDIVAHANAAMRAFPLLYVGLVDEAEPC